MLCEYNSYYSYSNSKIYFYFITFYFLSFVSCVMLSCSLIKNFILNLEVSEQLISPLSKEGFVVRTLEKNNQSLQHSD